MPPRAARSSRLAACGVMEACAPSNSPSAGASARRDVTQGIISLFQTHGELAGIIALLGEAPGRFPHPQAQITARRKLNEPGRKTFHIALGVKQAGFSVDHDFRDSGMPA